MPDATHSPEVHTLLESVKADLYEAGRADQGFGLAPGARGAGLGSSLALLLNLTEEYGPKVIEGSLPLIKALFPGATIPIAVASEISVFIQRLAALQSNHPTA